MTVRRWLWQKLVTGGVNFVLDAKAPKRKDLFLREAMLLKQSHSLCSSMTTEQERHEAAYMEAVRSTVVKIDLRRQRRKRTLHRLKRNQRPNQRTSESEYPEPRCDKPV